MLFSNEVNRTRYVQVVHRSLLHQGVASLCNRMMSPLAELILYLPLKDSISFDDALKARMI